MDGSTVDSITEIAQEAVSAVAKSENNWAAIILLVALLGVLALSYIFFNANRKSKAAEDAQRMAQMRTDYEGQLASSRITQDYIGRMNDRYDSTMNRVTEAFGENSAILRQAKEEIRRNAAALDRNTETLESIRAQTVPVAVVLPKKAVRRATSQSGEEQANG